MEFLKESGGLISPQRDLLYHFDNNSFGHVIFPSEMMLQLHRMAPGSIYMGTHVHPPRNAEMSSVDEITLRMWAEVFHPFPARLGVIAEMVTHTSSLFLFKETCYIAIMESFEEWEERGRKSPRQITVEKEWEKEDVIDLLTDYDQQRLPLSCNEYALLLLRKSYNTT